MKYQLLLWSLIAIIFGLESLDRHSTQAKPASIFHPIIEDIRTHIPSSLQIRLPAVLPTLAEDTTLYSFVPEGDLNMISMGKEDLDTFMVLVSKIPHCQTQENPLDCTVGIVGVSETTSSSDLAIEDLPDNIADLTPVKLNATAKGFYFVRDEDYQLVVWKQDGLAHLLITKNCDNDCVIKADLIDMARSAANEPAISSHDSSLYSY